MTNEPDPTRDPTFPVWAAVVVLVVGLVAIGLAVGFGLVL
jgi:hypothetical protein